MKSWDSHNKLLLLPLEQHIVTATLLWRQGGFSSQIAEGSIFQKCCRGNMTADTAELNKTRPQRCI